MNHSTLSAAMIGTTVLVVCFVASMSRGVFDAADALKTRLRYGQYDALSVARCEARCWVLHNKNPCIKTCLLKGFDKPGRCPKSDTSLSPFDAVCQETCQKDSQCPSITKCCPNGCKGVTCQQPEELLSLVEVPNIPRDVKVTEGNRKKTISIKWKPQLLPEALRSTTIYVIEERHHAGRNFIEERLSQWSYCGRSVKTSHILKNLAKPGRWYQFRVAAVNENGTKGFSENSPTFSVSASPKPPKAPQNVTTGPLWTFNGTLFVELRWAPPPSDLPIQKYKVFWSRRLHGAKALDSVLVHHQVVAKEQNKFLLQDLQPNSLYFLQVQAVVQFGKNRLRGEKSGLVLNTTNYTNVTDDTISTVNISTKSRIEGLRLHKLDWSQGHLRARIAWKPKKGPVRYTVSGWSGPCFKSVKPYSNLKFAATTKASHFDLHDLQFNCRYRVGVREVSMEGMKTIQDTSITFITPTCDKFKSNYKKVRCGR